MTECLINPSYYALVWNDSLNKKMKVKGELITRNTVLPKDPRMLYGTNCNDIAKIRNIGVWKEIEYDVLTTKQSVKFWKEVDEYILSRDVYIVVWEGEEYLDFPNNNYKIVSPELFEYIVQTIPEKVQTVPEKACELNIDKIEENKEGKAEENEEDMISNSVKEILSNIINYNNKKYKNGLNRDNDFKCKNKKGKIAIQLMLN